MLLDADLATLYGVLTKRLNEQVRRKNRYLTWAAFLRRSRYCAVLSWTRP
ncbi:MAG: ORF6N domain-containing protein [Azoarcus sp.]|nr:ORF6N domain-containing protein [Azoarcus sp.]